MNKFRVWDVDRKKMSYPEDPDNRDYFLLNQEGVLYCFDGIVIDNWSEHFKVMFSIGIKDKNSKDIYDGDLINSPFVNESVPVKWDQTFAQFTYGGAKFNIERKADQIEVIDNIYENNKSKPLKKKR